ncbi:MAG: hypothetical protein ABSG53_24600 [Thermoguttaceae bacterium]
MPDTLPDHPAPLPAPLAVDAFFAKVIKNVHERLARRKQEGIPGQSTFTISETAALTGNDVYIIRDMIRDKEIRATNPTGMQLLIPREEVLKIMAGNTDASAAQESI